MTTAHHRRGAPGAGRHEQWRWSGAAWVAATLLLTGSGCEEAGTIVDDGMFAADDGLIVRPELDLGAGPGDDGGSGGSDMTSADMGADVPADMPADLDMMMMPPPPAYPAIYAADETLSPLTRHVVERLRQIAGRGASLQDDVFAKVGASNTVNPNFMGCFAGAQVELDGRDHLQGAIDHFRAGDAAGATPYTRESLAAMIGKSAGWAISGMPSPLQQEIDALQPRFALVHYGTNDIQRDDLHGYAADLLTIVDQLTEQGVIPVLTTIPPRDDSAAAAAQVPYYVAAMRAVAQARQVPLIDLWHQLDQLPTHGLGPDGIHLDVLAPGQGCVFTPQGLQHGHNVRNLYTMEMLAALHQSIVRGEDVFDPSGPERIGDGSPAAPIQIEGLPFADVRDTRAGASSHIDAYPACDSGQDESGAEFFYQITVDRPTNVRAFVFDRGQVDVDLHLLTDGANPDSCVQRAHVELAATLQPNTTYTFSLDTFVNSSGEVLAGEYIFMLVEEEG